MAEWIYHFPNLGKTEAVIVQAAIDKRFETLKLQGKTNKAILAVLDELDQMNEDLNRHIASLVRQEEYKKQELDPANL